MIGFAIGISSIKIVHWSINGIVMGFLFSLPLAFSGLMAPDNPEFSKIMMFTSTVVMGMIYGFLIELVTTLYVRLNWKSSVDILISYIKSISSSTAIFLMMWLAR